MYGSNSIQFLVKSENYHLRSAIKNYHGHEEIVLRFKVCTDPYPERGSANERRPLKRAGPEKARRLFKWGVKREMSFPIYEPATKKRKPNITARQSGPAK